MQPKPFSLQIFPKLFEIANFQIYLPRENLVDEMKASDDEIPGLSLICNFFSDARSHNKIVESSEGLEFGFKSVATLNSRNFPLYSD